MCTEILIADAITESKRTHRSVDGCLSRHVEPAATPSAPTQARWPIMLAILAILATFGETKDLPATLRNHSPLRQVANGLNPAEDHADGRGPTLRRHSQLLFAQSVALKILMLHPNQSRSASALYIGKGS